MNQPYRPPLRTNPFTTYRDPQTGRWQVVLADAFSRESDPQGKASTGHLSSNVAASSEPAIARDMP